MCASPAGPGSRSAAASGIAPGRHLPARPVAPLSARSTDYQALTVVLPRALFGAHQGGLDALHGAVIRGATPFGRMLNDHLRSLGTHATGFSARRPPRPRRRRRCCSARRPSACRITSGPPRGPRGAPLLPRHAPLHRGRAGLPDLNAEMLGRRFGVSRSALYRLFVPLGGVSGYIRQRRLDRAYRELAAGDGRFARISEVAYRWRFESPAHFAQAFRAEFGCPRDVRARATTPPGEPVQAESWTDFYDWVLKLAA
ncbi:helix-turn-helix transcriptional regulator [Methylobacterium oryzae CBMB20]